LTAPAHVIVLAAGRGSRLGGLGARTPKWLLPVGRRTLADRQLEGLARADGAVASVRVVVGHAAEEIRGALAGRREDVRVIVNPRFAELNNWWSLLLALRGLPEDEPVAVLNGDLLADPAQVAAFLREAPAAEADGVLAVDLGKELTDESMKVWLTPDRTLARIGKEPHADAAGEYIGMLLVRREALRRLRAELERFVGRPEAANEWYEGAIGRTAAQGSTWGVWAMPTGGWVEIDDHADLATAEAMVRS